MVSTQPYSWQKPIFLICLDFKTSRPGINHTLLTYTTYNNISPEGKAWDQHKTNKKLEVEIKSHSTNYVAHGRPQQYYEKQKNDGFAEK
jgi:hypothetical protein